MEDAIVDAAVRALASKSAPRECIAALRQLVHAISRGVVRPPAPDDLLRLLSAGAFDPASSAKRALCTNALSNLAPVPDPDPILSNLRTSTDAVGQERALTVLLAMGSDAAFAANLPNFSQWLSALDPHFRHTAVPALVAATRRCRAQLAHAAHLQPAESALAQVLTRASGAPAAQEKSPWMAIRVPSSSSQVVEPDGTPARDFYTVLNATGAVSLEQHLNHHAFSAVRAYLTSVYLAGDAAQAPAPSAEFLEAVTAYCLRVMDQAKLKPDAVSNAAFAEALRVLDVVCSVDPQQAARILPIAKRSAALPASQADGPVFIAHLQLFLNHSASFANDIEPFFQSFFESFISSNYSDQVVAYETLSFCLRNRDKIATQTRVFPLHYMHLLKLLAWHSQMVYRDFMELIPSLVTKATCVDLFNSVVDLPLLASALDITIGKRLDDATSDEQVSMAFRLLNAYMQHGNDVHRLDFCQNVLVTPRVLAASRIVVPLARAVFDAAVASDSCELSLQELLVSEMGRFDGPTQLYRQLPSYHTDIKREALSQIMGIFRQQPTLLSNAEVQAVLVEAIASGINERTGELVLVLVWAIGEYACTHYNPDITVDSVGSFVEALEALVLTQILPDSAPGLFTTRTALTVINALAKLGARWQCFSTRVILCLCKIVVAGALHPSVALRAHECIAVLKTPSVASVLLDVASKCRPGSLVDENSALPYHLQPNTLHSPSGSFHMFTLQSAEDDASS
eukprot:m51a1_g8978 Adaptor protein complex 5 (AP-5), zeta subunit (741) ;mRNA; f:38533-41150